MLATLTLAAALAVPSPVGPETRYDPRIPTLKQVTGHELGEEISSPDEIGAYLDALAAAAPDRARVVEYARSEEGRPLRVLVLGSPERLARLDAVQSGAARARRPALLCRPPRPTASCASSRPSCGCSTPSTATRSRPRTRRSPLAYHLLAAQDDPGADLVRREAIVLIDPLQNPDGRARFLASNAPGPRGPPRPRARLRRARRAVAGRPRRTTTSST